MTHGVPALRVSTRARWTLNAFAGGYCREVGKEGMLNENAKPGPHRVLMEGLEAFASLLRNSRTLDEEEPVQYATTRDGRKYVSALGTR